MDADAPSNTGSITPTYPLRVLLRLYGPDISGTSAWIDFECPIPPHSGMHLSTDWWSVTVDHIEIHRDDEGVTIYAAAEPEKYANQERIDELRGYGFDVS